MGQPASQLASCVQQWLFEHHFIRLHFERQTTGKHKSLKGAIVSGSWVSNTQKEKNNNNVLKQCYRFLGGDVFLAMGMVHIKIAS